MSLQNERKINVTPAVMRKSGVYTLEVDEDTLSLQVKRTENNGTVTEHPLSLDTNITNAQDQDLLVANAEGSFVNTPLRSVISSATDLVQGYYGLLTDFYFGGDATDTVIAVSDVDTWIDVEISINSEGVFDRRPTDMVDANATGITGSGAAGSPIVFSLEGLDTNAFLNFRASMAFEPDEDEGQVESRLLFNRHSGTVPSGDFSIEEVSLSMFNGANVDYVSEPMLSFFIGDTIDTNGVGDAGKCRFQVKSNVAGTVKLRALTWYINK